MIGRGTFLVMVARLTILHPCAGDMSHEMIGEWDFVDEKNGVRTRLIFDPPCESGSKAKAPPSDYFAGVVER